MMAGIAWLQGLLFAIGAVFIAILAASPPAVAQANLLDQPMRFVLVRNDSPMCGLVCAEWISAEGSITADTPNRLKAILKTLGKRRLPIIIHSPGGDVDGALATGRLIRSKRLDVAVGQTIFSACAPVEKGCKPEKDGLYRGIASNMSGMCNSACSWILAGGVTRLVGPSAYIGVHQITTTFFKETVYYRTEYRMVKGKKKVVSKKVTGRKRAGSYKTTKLGADLRKKLLAYQAEMGIDAGFLDVAQRTPAQDLSQVYLALLLRMNIATSTDDASAMAGAPICKLQPRPGNCREIPPPTPEEVAAQFVAGAVKADPDMAKDIQFVLVRGSNSRCEPLCPEWISAKGRIGPGSADRLRKLLKTLDGAKPPLVISSPGGKADAAMELGRAIRKAGLRVSVGKTLHSRCAAGAPECTRSDGKPGAQYLGMASSAQGACFSECLLALAGGVERQAGVGSSLGWATSPPKGKAAARLDAYFQEMSVPRRIMKEPPEAPLTDWTQWRLAKMQVLTDAASFEGMVDAAKCGTAPGHCPKSTSVPPVTVATIRNPVGDAAGRALGQKPMDFVLVRGLSPLCDPDCPEWIAAEGAIDADVPRRFEEMMARVGGRRLPVLINSKGGDVVAAMALGQSIRRNRLDVAVAGTRYLPCGPRDTDCMADGIGAYVGTAIPHWAECLTECPVALAGGVNRMVDSGTHVGIQRLTLGRTLLQYFVEMGIDPEMLSQLHAIKFVSERELEIGQLADLKLVTTRERIDSLVGPKVCIARPRPDNCRLVQLTQ